jgi:adenosylcobinamide kinase/adenosylcobinamide-phosphate guanylyltransferase
MDVRFAGTGGLAGWPEPGCRCASCRRAAAAGRRRPGALLVDGVLRIEPGRAPAPDGTGHQVSAVPGGWDITGPDGGRLLAAAGPGQVPRPPAGAGPFGLLVLDLLGDPAQLGELRARGLAPEGAAVAAGWADHRVSSAAELARRCRLWRAVPPADGDVLISGGASPAPGGPHRTLVLGGARSGKSREAELRLAGEPRVTYLAAGPWPAATGPDGTRPTATGPDGARPDEAGPDGAWPAGTGPDDPEWAARVAAHRAARPGWWATVESTDVAGALRRLDGAVLIDGIGTWLAAAMTEAGAWPEFGGPSYGGAGDGNLAARIADLIAAWRECGARVVAVSDEVGAGIVPDTAAGRLFRDQLGWLNQRLAAESEETVLVAAGRVIDLPG